MIAADPTPSPAKTAVLQALPKHLRVLAHAVRKLGSGYGGSPEKLATDKDQIAVMLTSLAVLIERGDLIESD
jgi:hypothetical protein